MNKASLNLIKLLYFSFLLYVTLYVSFNCYFHFYFFLYTFFDNINIKQKYNNKISILNKCVCIVVIISAAPFYFVSLRLSPYLLGRTFKYITVKISLSTVFFLCDSLFNILYYVAKGFGVLLHCF